MLTFALIAFLRQPLGQAFAWTLSLVDGAATRLALRLGVIAASTLLLCLALLLTGGIALLLVDMRQLTSELGRLWLMAGAAWFFFLRGTPLTERLVAAAAASARAARDRSHGRSCRCC